MEQALLLNALHLKDTFFFLHYVSKKLDPTTNIT